MKIEVTVKNDAGKILGQWTCCSDEHCPTVVSATVHGESITITDTASNTFHDVTKKDGSDAFAG